MKIFSWKGILITGLSFGLLAAVAVGAFVLRLPAVEGQIPAAPMIVTLTLPVDGTGAGAGSTVRVSAQVVAPHPVVLVELWIDGAPAIPMNATSAGTNVYSASADWIATPGSHVLVARGTDDQGHVGLSNVVRVDGLVATDSMAMEPFIAQGGETLEALAQAFGTTVPAIQTYNRGLSEGQALEPGQELSIPVPSHYEATWDEPPSAAPIPENIGTAAAEISPLGFWLRTAFSPAPTAPPAPSGISAAAAGCDVSLAIDDNSEDELGFFLYRLGPESPAFERIAAFGPHEGESPFSFIDTQLSGTYTYYAAAFNPAGESPGTMAQVTLPSASCGTAEWSGSLTLVGSLLTSPIVADQAYFYASVNGGQWRRVPSDPNAFLPALQQGYDVSPYLADLAGGAGGAVTTLSLDGWGWGGGTLVSLGQGNLVAAPLASSLNVGDLYMWTALQGSPTANVVLSPSGGQPMYYSEEVVFSKPLNFGFRWKTGSPSASSARWEVATSPFFFPSSILAQGVEGLNPSWEGYDYFNIPFDEILALTLNIGEQPTTSSMQAQVPFGSEQALNLGEGKSVAFTQGSLAGFGAPGGQATADAFALGNVAPPGGGVKGEYYVRLTPMLGNQIAGETSNTVIVRYEPDEGGFEIEIPTLGPEYYTPLYDVEIVEYTPGAMEDPNSWGCVEVVKVVPGSLAAQLGYEVGDRHCPRAWSGDNAWYDKLGEDLAAVGGWMKKGLDWAAKTWQDIKAFAIMTLMKYSGVDAVCELAEGAVLPEGACENMVTTAVDVGLASMGIPPTLPNFDKLMDEGIDYAVELASEQALAKLPACVGPCEDAVKDKIREALEGAIDVAANQSVAPSCVSEEEAHAYGAEVWCPPAGMVVRPALGAVASPPAILVKLTRRADVPDPANLPACRLNVAAVYTLHGWNVNYPEFSASPYGSASLEIPPLSPGESMKVAVALNSYRMVDLPWKSYIGSPWAFHDAFSMVWYGTSHPTAGASFVTPAYAAGSPPAPCAPTVTGEEVGSQTKGWKSK